MTDTNTLNDRRAYPILMVNHAAIFVITLLGMLLVTNLATAVVGSLNLLDGKIFTHGYEANPRFGTWLQNRGAIVYTYSAGPIAALVIAAIAKVAHALYFHKQRNDIRMFLFWIYLHGATLFIGGALVGMVTQRGFGHAILYGTAAALPYRIVITFVSMILLIIVGARSIRYHLEHSPNEDLVLQDNRDSRMSYLFSVSAVPYIIGSLILTLFQLPGLSLVLMLTQLTMLLIIIPSVSFHKLSFRFFLQPEPQRLYIKWSYVLTAVLLFTTLRLLLAGGLTFKAFL